MWIKLEISNLVRNVLFLKYSESKPFATFKLPFACGKWRISWTTLLYVGSISSAFHARFFANILSPKSNKAKLQLEKSCAKHLCMKNMQKMLMKLTPILFKYKGTNTLSDYNTWMILLSMILLSSEHSWKVSSKRILTFKIGSIWIPLKRWFAYVLWRSCPINNVFFSTLACLHFRYRSHPHLWMFF